MNSLLRIATLIVMALLMSGTPMRAIQTAATQISAEGIVYTPEAAIVLDKHALEQQLGRELKFKEKLALKILNRKIEKQQKAEATDTPLKSNGMAIAGFVCGIVSLFFAGIILGILAIVFSAIAMSRIKSEPGVWSGKGLAVAGLVLGIVGVVGALVAISIFL